MRSEIKREDIIGCESYVLDITNAIEEMLSNELALSIDREIINQIIKLGEDEKRQNRIDKIQDILK